MTPSSATIQHVTNASGTVAIASSSTSIGVTKVTEGVMTNPTVIENINTVVSMADMIALCSLIVLVLSFLYNMYATRKRRKMDELSYDLRTKEYNLELAKFKTRNIERMGKSNKED